MGGHGHGHGHGEDVSWKNPLYQDEVWVLTTLILILGVTYEFFEHNMRHGIPHTYRVVVESMLNELAALGFISTVSASSVLGRAANTRNERAVRSCGASTPNALAPCAPHPGTRTRAGTVGRGCTRSPAHPLCGHPSPGFFFSPRQTTFMITNQGHGDSKSMLQRFLDSVSGPSLPASSTWHARVRPARLGRRAPVGLLVTRAWGRAEKMGTTFGHMLHDFETIHFALFFVVNFYFVQVLRGRKCYGGAWPVRSCYCVLAPRIYVCICNAIYVYVSHVTHISTHKGYA
jgi:hypothetical protein